MPHWCGDLFGNVLRDVSKRVSIWLSVTKLSGILHADSFQHFRPPGVECLVKPWFDVDSKSLCIYFWYAASSEGVVGKDFMESRIGSKDRRLMYFADSNPRCRSAVYSRSKPWFEVTSKTLLWYAWYETSFEYGAVNVAVGACKFVKASSLNSIAAGFLVAPRSGKLLISVNLSSCFDQDSTG